MAAGKDQPQAIVLDALVVPLIRIAGAGFELFGEFLQRRIMPSTPSYAVDGLETSGRDEPSSGIGWYAVARPLFDRDSKGFMQRLFGSFKIAEETD